MNKFTVLCISIFYVVVSISTAKEINESEGEEFREARVSNFFLSTKKFSYSEASVFCTELSGQLLSIETAEKDAQAESTLARNGLASSPVWTSGMYEKASDAWVWGSSSSAVFSYTNWLKGPSHKSPNSTQCVYIVKESSEYGWNYNMCQENYRFICEL